MREVEQVKEYAKKKYPNRFKKKTVIRDGKGKIQSSEITELEPIVEDNGIFYTVRNHVDASPIILSKTILG